MKQHLLFFQTALAEMVESDEIWAAVVAFDVDMNLSNSKLKLVFGLWWWLPVELAIGLLLTVRLVVQLVVVVVVVSFSCLCKEPSSEGSCCHNQPQKTPQ